MAKDVLCEVNNCTFWAQGNECSAAYGLERSAPKAKPQLPSRQLGFCFYSRLSGN
ncbi:DUF1540 domain-containing protein [Bacillus sp. Hm123]|uniref:DUF1540 domain-containing protein n=1 Tax=Bacillus sp. Hm123 TaxID=3450745 RepID=UPI003F43B204